MRARSVLLFSVLRLLAFLVPFGILMIFPVFQDLPWLAAIFAAIIGLCLSVLFLRRPLADATAGLGQRRARADTAAHDAEIEDAAADAFPAEQRPSDPPPSGER
jgi:hypothetical protein